MNKDYQKNEKLERKAWHKYRKALIKIAIAVGVSFLGIIIPAGPIAEFLVSFIPSDLAVLISIMSKVALSSFGVLLGIKNIISANLAKRKMNDLEDYEEGMVENLEQEIKKGEDKSQSLQERLTRVQEDNKNLEKKLADINKREESLDIKPAEYSHSSSHKVYKK